MQKGTFGYINRKKKEQLIKTIIAFSISFIILIVGYLLNNNSKQNLFTIIAVLIVLPATKILIGYIVFFPYHSVSKEVYEEVLAKKSNNDILFTDLVFTSSQKVMNLSFLMIKGDQIFGLSEHKKANIKYMQEYLQRLIDGKGLSYSIIIEKEYASFLREVDKDIEHTVERSIETELHNMFMSILV